ncbi:beta-glucosidase [Rhodanobacter sp. 115]|nr:beta-glucosidase [Rhodanobacter sp. 115]
MLTCFGASAASSASKPARPWLNTHLSPDQRASLVVKAMTQDEKFQLIDVQFGDTENGHVMSPGALASAGYDPAIKRLGLPALQESDAGLGVAKPHKLGATALPSGLATAASFDPALAYAGGAMIGSEAHHRGFNVMLAGGADLVRDPRNGRNFEYAGEDPLLTGLIVGHAIAGIQSQHVVSTIKHYAFNDLETARTTFSADINPTAARESDLLAFEIAIETGHPGSVMCSYNRVNSVYACENDWLLDKVLKRDWHYPGYVMSDWGAVHSAAKSALAGLDQESAGETFDKEVYFGKPLRAAVASGEVPQSRIDDMAHRILRSLFASGVIDHPAEQAPIDFAADRKVAQHVEEAGAVLLRNQDALLPLVGRAIGGRHRRPRRQGRTDRRWLLGGAVTRRQCRAGPGAHRMAGAAHLPAFCTVDRDPATRPWQGELRQRRGHCRRRETGRAGQGGGGVRRAMVGGKLRHAAPDPARQPGRVGRRRGQGQPAHHRRAGKQRPGRDAVAGPGWRGAGSVVSRRGRRRGHRTAAVRRSRSRRAPAGVLAARRSAVAAPADPRCRPGLHRPDTARPAGRAGGLQHRRRERRLPLVPAQGHPATVPVRLRPGLYALRLQRLQAAYRPWPRGGLVHGDQPRQARWRGRTAVVCHPARQRPGTAAGGMVPGQPEAGAVRTSRSHRRPSPAGELRRVRATMAASGRQLPTATGALCNFFPRPGLRDAAKGQLARGRTAEGCIAKLPSQSELTSLS